MSDTIQPVVGTFDRTSGALLGIGPPGVTPTPIGGSGSEGESLVATTDTASQIRTKVETTGTAAELNSPAGKGRRVVFPSGKMSVVQSNLSTLQSIQGAGKGSTFLSFSFTTDPGAGTYAMFQVLDDSTSFHGARGQASIRDVLCYGNSVSVGGGTIPLDRVVHGYFSDTRSQGVAHTMMDVDYMNFTGDGVHVLAGNDQMMMNHVRSEGNDGWGYWIVGASDCKSRACGAQGNATGGIHVESCATFRWRDFDCGNPNGTSFKGTYTVELVDMSRASFDTGEISGRVLVSGRNDQGTGVRYEEAQNTFRNVSFKVDENLPGAYAANGKTGQYTSQVVLEDVDGTIFDNCRFMYGDVAPSQAMLDATPNYFIEFTSLTGGGAANRRGWCKFTNMHGLVHRRGRVADSFQPVVAFKKHYANYPNLVEWDFTPGAPELVNYDSTNPPRDYVLCGDFGATTGPTYNKADYPFGYLWATLANGTSIPVNGTLDDANTTWTAPIGPYAAPAGKRWMMRVWP